MTKLILLLALFCGQARAEIRETKHMREVIRAADKGTLLVFDIDNTLIEPVNQLGSDQWFYYLARKYKEADGLTDAAAFHKAGEVWGAVQSTIKVKAVESYTPQLIREAQRRGIRAFALTARTADISARTNLQLESVGVNLSAKPVLEKDFEIQSVEIAKYTKGVMYVGEGNDKGEILVKFIGQLKQKPKLIIFVDDKPKHAKSMDKALADAKIKGIVFRYGGADAKVKAFNEDTADLKLFSLGQLPEAK